MEIQSENIDNISILRLEGELDASSAIKVDKAIKLHLEKGRQHLLIDGAKLDYISSAGIGVFVAYLENIQENNGKIAFFSLLPSVLSVFQMLGIDQIITIADNEQAAKKSLLES